MTSCFHSNCSRKPIRDSIHCGPCSKWDKEKRDWKRRDECDKCSD